MIGIPNFHIYLKAPLTIDFKKASEKEKFYHDGKCFLRSFGSPFFSWRKEKM